VPSDPGHLRLARILESSTARRERSVRYSVPGKALALSFGRFYIALDWSFFAVITQAAFIPIILLLGYSLYLAGNPAGSLAMQATFWVTITINIAIVLRSLLTFKLLLVSSKSIRILTLRPPSMRFAKESRIGNLTAYIGQVSLSRTYNYKSIRSFWLVAVAVGDIQFPLGVFTSQEQAWKHVAENGELDAIMISPELPRVFGIWLY
jgi:hypothetical protein